MFRSLGLALTAVLWASTAQAALITYEVTLIDGNRFRYDYAVANDGAITTQLALFDILFDPALYDEASLLDLSDAALATEWSSLFLGSAPGVPAAFDVLAFDGLGLGVGGNANGFAVEFSWLGQGLPGAQGFEVYDPSSFVLLGTGTSATREPPAPVPVPEPGSLMLCLGLLLVACSRRRKHAWRADAEPHSLYRDATNDSVAN